MASYGTGSRLRSTKERPLVASGRPGAVEVAIQHGAGMNRNPVGPPPCTRFRIVPPTIPPTGAGVGGHGEWCWA